MDERFYCVTHKIPVEYIPELDLYTCGRCETTYKKGEVIPARLLEPPSIKDAMEEAYRNSGETAR